MHVPSPSRCAYTALPPASVKFIVTSRSTRVNWFQPGWANAAEKLRISVWQSIFVPPLEYFQFSTRVEFWLRTTTLIAGCPPPVSMHSISASGTRST